SKLFIITVIVFLNLSSFSQTPRSAKDFDKRGREHFVHGDYDEAIADFTHIIELTSRLGVGDHLSRNNMSTFNETADEAAASSNITVLDPRTADAYVNRGKAFFAKGDTDNAILDYNHALTISPASAVAYF